MSDNNTRSAFASDITMGLSKQEYVATKVLAALLSGDARGDEAGLARLAVKYADALLRITRN